MNNHTFAILAYKESVYLEECISSLKKQTLPSTIIICSSTPNKFLEDIALKHELAFFVNPEKNGIASDFNFALDHAQTSFVTLAHQDDIYHPTYSEKILQAMESRSDTLIAYCDYDEIIHSAAKISLRCKSLNFSIKRMLNILAFGNKKFLLKNKNKLLRFGNPIGCPAVTYCKNNLGDFKFDSNFSVNLDWDAWQRLAGKDGSFHWIRQSLMSHRIHTESETSQGLKENRRQNEDLQIFERLWPKPIALFLSFMYALSYNNNN